jgi:hypothetical protein
MMARQVAGLRSAEASLCRSDPSPIHGHEPRDRWSARCLTGSIFAFESQCIGRERPQWAQNRLTKVVVNGRAGLGIRSVESDAR